jgi:hypothetical protein
MFTVEPAWFDLARWQAPGAPVLPPGCPWSVRLAGLSSACPALELYEHGELVDVVSSTRLAAPLLRGARAVSCAAGHQAVAWGRLQPAGQAVAVEFSRGRFSRQARPTTVIKLTEWCWVALGAGRFDAVTVHCDGQRVRRRLARR